MILRRCWFNNFWVLLWIWDYYRIFLFPVLILVFFRLVLLPPVFLDTVASVAASLSCSLNCCLLILLSQAAVNSSCFFLIFNLIFSTLLVKSLKASRESRFFSFVASGHWGCLPPTFYIPVTILLAPSVFLFDSGVLSILLDNSSATVVFFPVLVFADMVDIMVVWVGIVKWKVRLK